MIHHYKNLKAFTLSEVLITLGIIGIVAVLTLSTVIQNIQNKQNIAKWKKEYSIISTAFNEVVADGVTICEAYRSSDGICISKDNNYIGTPTTEYYNGMMSKLKFLDYCGSSSIYPREKVCDYTNINNGEWWNKNGKYKWSGINGSATRTGYKALGDSLSSSNGINNYNFSSLALLLTDGAAVYFGALWDGPWIVVDVNNFTKGPNQFGRDVFVIRVISNIKKDKHYLAPAGSSAIYEISPSLDNESYGITGCSKDIGVQTSNNVYQVAGAGCSAKYLLE